VDKNRKGHNVARTNSKGKSPEERKAEVEAAVEKLHGKVAEITSSDEWRAYLASVARFHDYSVLNAMWLTYQWEERQIVQAVFRLMNPAIPALPHASHFAAFSDWRDKFKRPVQKGEKGLSVMAPVLVTDREAKPLANGKQPQKLIGFRLANRTFESHQTDGEPLPRNPVRADLLDGDGDDALWTALVGIATDLGFTVKDEAPFHPGANGSCDYSLNEIRVHPDRPEAQRVKTLIHELGHAVLHGPSMWGFDDQSAKEVEAESVAFTVSELLGRDTSDYSLGYVVHWAKGNGALIAATTERVVDTAWRIIDALDGSGVRDGKAKPLGIDKTDDNKEVAA